jgi:hypothetical protein
LETDFEEAAVNYAVKSILKLEITVGDAEGKALGKWLK